MTSITPDHLARGAFIYVRQSTSDQLLHNHESRRRQYGGQQYDDRDQRRHQSNHDR